MEGVRDNSKFFLIGGLVLLLLIIAGAIFWLNSGEKVKEKPTEMESMEGGEEIPEVISNGCEKLGLSFNTQQAYSCFDDTNNLVKIYVSRSSENVILKKIDFKLSSLNDSINYSSSYGLAPGSFYIYSIPFTPDNVQKIEFIATVQDDGGEKACEPLFINYLQSCVVEEVVSAEPEPDYYYDANLNVVLVNTSNNISNVTNGSSASGISATSFFSSKPQKKILNFSLDSISGEIDEVRHRIFVNFPDNRSLKFLVPLISISENATISPLSGVGKDFTSPVNYVVKASDNSTQQYTIYASNYVEEIIKFPETTNETNEEINLTDVLNLSDEDSLENYNCTDGSCEVNFSWTYFNESFPENETSLASPSTTLVNNLSGTVAGNWSTNLSAASQMAQMNRKFYIINYGNLQSCSYCTQAENNIFSKPEWKKWAYDNGIATIYASSKLEGLEPTKTIRQRYVDPLLRSGVSIGFPFIVIVGYENTNAVASFTYRKGYVINGIKANLTVTDFIKIVDSYTGKYKTNITTVSLSSSSSYSLSPNYNVSWYLPSTKTISSGVTDSSIANSGSVAGEWTKDLPAARNLAKQNNKFFIVNFGRTSGCSLCSQLDDAVYRYSEFKNWAKQNGIPLVYANYNNQTSFYLIKNSLLSSVSGMGFPTVAFVDEKDGKTIYGYSHLGAGGTYNWIDMSSVWSPIGFSLVARSYVEGSYLRNYSSTRIFNTNSYGIDWGIDEVSVGSLGVIAKSSMYSLTNKPITVLRDGQKINLTLQGSCSTLCAGSWTPNIIQAYNFSKINNKFMLLYLEGSSVGSHRIVNTNSYAVDETLNKLIINQPALMLWANKNNISLAYGLLANNSSSTYRLVSVTQQNQSSLELDFIKSLYSSSENISLPAIILVDGQSKRVIAKFNYTEGQVYNGIRSYPNVKRFTEVIHSFVG